MNPNAPDPRLDALLRDLPAPPPVPAGLAARVLEAAAAVPQEARSGRARKAARRDRRGRWLRRPILASTAALGLIVTSAVAATLAGVPIPQKIAAVFFPAEKAAAPKQAAAPRRAVRPQAAAANPVRTVDATPAAEPDDIWLQRPNPWRRLLMAERIVAARRAMGLPTPGADRIERQLRRRAAIWQAATPEQREAWAARQQLRQDVRRAMLSTPEGREELARQDRERRWRARGRANLPLGPEQWAERQRLIRAWRARRAAGLPLSPEEQATLQSWRAQRQAGMPPLTDQQRAFRQEQFRRWREARRARWQEMNGQAGAGPPPSSEGTGAPDR